MRAGRYVRLVVVATLFVVAQPLVGAPLVAPAQGALTRGPALAGAAMAEDPATGKVILFGGVDSLNNLRSDTWLWDGTNWDLVASKTLNPEARFHAAMAADPVTGTVVLFGGLGRDLGEHNAKTLSDTWVWDGRDQTWTPQAAVVTRLGAGAVSMATDTKSGTVLLYIVVGDGTQNETWSWSGTAKKWTKEQPTTSPSPRVRLGGMANDGATGTVVLFGGLDYRGFNTPTVRLNDTWVWDGIAKTWTNRTPATSPRSRLSAALAYHPPTKKVLLFGGDSNLDVLGDTWTWNGVTGTWLKERPVNRPPARYDGDMAHVSLTGQLALHGGSGASDSGRRPLSRDTWAWNGVNWKHKA